ncbi:MAG: hypothetical protein PHY55_00135 [Bacteroidales bacterium]|nr:hypothetical protein [Bacteroidales bacterium]
MRKFKSVRNGQIAELISENEKQVIIKLETGEEKAISPATLKRWWKEMEEEPQSEEVVTETTQEETTEEPVEEPAEEVNVIDVTDEEPAQIDFTEFEDTPEPKKEKKPKKKRERISGDHPLKEFIEGLATERNTEVFQATVPSFRSLKVDGKMYMAFTFNKKGVTLWMRSAAVQELTEYKKMNHMFDARVQFGEDNAENRKEITKLLDASLKFQIDKQAARASKK